MVTPRGRSRAAARYGGRVAGHDGVEGAREAGLRAAQARGVALTAAKLERNAGELLLPAQLLPYEQTQLFARVDGYVAKWHADRGARVKAGQLLAEIDAPELDQQVRQSEAALDQGAHQAAIGRGMAVAPRRGDRQP